MDKTIWNAFRAYRRGTLGADHTLIDNTLPTVLSLVPAHQVEPLYRIIKQRYSHFKRHYDFKTWLEPIAYSLPHQDFYGEPEDVDVRSSALRGLESGGRRETLRNLKNVPVRLTLNGFLPALVCGLLLLVTFDISLHTSKHFQHHAALAVLWGAVIYSIFLSPYFQRLVHLLRIEWRFWGALTMSSLLTLLNFAYLVALDRSQQTALTELPTCACLPPRTPPSILSDQLTSFSQDSMPLIATTLFANIAISTLVLMFLFGLIQKRPWVSSFAPPIIRRTFNILLLTVGLGAAGQLYDYISARTLDTDLYREAATLDHSRSINSPVSEKRCGRNNYFRNARDDYFHPYSDSHKFSIISAVGRTQVRLPLGLKRLADSCQTEFEHGGSLSPWVRAALNSRLRERQENRPVGLLKSKLLLVAAREAHLPIWRRSSDNVKMVNSAWEFLQENPEFCELSEPISVQRSHELSIRFPLWTSILNQSTSFNQINQYILKVLVENDLAQCTKDTRSDGLSNSTALSLANEKYVFDWSLVSPILREKAKSKIGTR